MTEAYAWADHRIFEAATGPGGKALLFGTDHASLFALDGSTRDVLARWRQRESIDLRKAPSPDREVLEALRDALVLVPAGPRRRPAPMDPANIPLGTLVL